MGGGGGCGYNYVGRRGDGGVWARDTLLGRGGEGRRGAACGVAWERFESGGSRRGAFDAGGGEWGRPTSLGRGMGALHSFSFCVCCTKGEAGGWRWVPLVWHLCNEIFFS